MTLPRPWAFGEEHVGVRPGDAPSRGALSLTPSLPHLVFSLIKSRCPQPGDHGRCGMPGLHAGPHGGSGAEPVCHWRILTWQTSGSTVVTSPSPRCCLAIGWRTQWYFIEIPYILKDTNSNVKQTTTTKNPYILLKNCNKKIKTSRTYRWTQNNNKHRVLHVLLLLLNYINMKSATSGSTAILPLDGGRYKVMRPNLTPLRQGLFCSLLFDNYSIHTVLCITTTLF